MAEWTDPGVFEVAPGVHRIPLPLPNDGLHTVNVYAISDGDGLVLIDAGWAGRGHRPAGSVARRPRPRVRRHPPVPGHAPAPRPLLDGRRAAEAVRHARRARPRRAALDGARARRARRGVGVEPARLGRARTGGFELERPALPLGDYLDSLRLTRELPDLRLLPAHGPVTGSVHKRVDELLLHHEERLDDTALSVAGGTATAHETVRRLGWTRRQRKFDELDLLNQVPAAGETAAHLDVLVRDGRLAASTVDGVVHYSATLDRW